jgi:hypothetical protein
MPGQSLTMLAEPRIHEALSNRKLLRPKPIPYHVFVAELEEKEATHLKENNSEKSHRGTALWSISPRGFPNNRPPDLG